MSILKIAQLIFLFPTLFIDINIFRRNLPINNRKIITNFIKFFLGPDEAGLKISAKNNNEFSKNLSIKGFAKDQMVFYDNFSYVDKAINNDFEKWIKSDLKISNRHFETKNVLKNFYSDKKLSEFLLQDKIYSKISNYIKYKPILFDVSYMYSHKEQYKDNSSAQLFHSDYEDYSSIKLFWNLHDITEDNGPFTFINREISSKIYSETAYSKNPSNKRLDDELIEKYEKKKNWQNIIGPKDGALYIDSTACLHFGSRLKKGSRKLVQFYFVSPYAYVLEREFFKFFKKYDFKSEKEILFSYAKFKYENTLSN